MRRRVVITGIGAVSPLGVGAQALYEGWRDGRSGIEDGFGMCRDFEATDFMASKQARRSDRFAQLVIAASVLAVGDAGWDEDAPPCEPAHVGCVIGSGIGGMSTFEGSCDTLRERGPERVSPLSGAVAADGREGASRRRRDRRRRPAGLVPADPRRVYDVRGVIGALVDGGELLVVSAGWARNLVTGMARIDGRPVGVIANQPRHLGGVLDADSSQKGARFVAKCNAFGAFITMNSKELGADYVFAWPQAQIGVMGAKPAVGIIHRRELAAAYDPAATRERLADHYAHTQLRPEVAASTGYVDELISPGDTRARLEWAFRSLRAQG